MNTDRDTALDELATVVAEATVDAWLAGAIKVADKNHFDESITNRSTNDGATTHKSLSRQDEAQRR